jgi:poly(3-hydroxyalkanoate) depolymerase
VIAEERSVVVDGQRLRVAVRPGRAAAGSRPALLLINGIGVSLEMLEPLVAELDPDVDVIRFDPPGIGGSAPSPVPYHFTGLSGLISRMLTELGYGRVDVLGISWGGGVAQDFALFRGDRCRRLVLAATATGALVVPARQSVLAQLMVLPPRRQMDREYLYRIVGEVFGGSARKHPERAAAAMSDGDWLGSPLGYLYQLTATAGWTSLPFLPVIRQPTLILAGDDDPVIPLANARLLNLLIPRSRLHVYHGGHLALATEAAELARAVDAFLAAPLPGRVSGSLETSHRGDLRGLQILRARELRQRGDRFIARVAPPRG